MPKAFRDLSEISPKLTEKFASFIEELDLSNNRIRILVLDSNLIEAHTRLPRLPQLTTLSLNDNKIDNLPIFVDSLTASFPNLRVALINPQFLSLLKNAACPNFFNGGTPQQYADYRRYLVSHLPSLTHVDSSPVTEEERRAARAVYNPPSKGEPTPNVLHPGHRKRSAKRKAGQAKPARKAKPVDLPDPSALDSETSFYRKPTEESSDWSSEELSSDWSQ